MRHGTVDALIVGSGVAGLMAADKLQSDGWRVLVVEAEEIVGGRMATQRFGTGLADVGAQFFTVRSAVFQQVVTQWLADGVVYEWARGWGEEDGFPRYAAKAGMAALARYLAAGVAVKTGVKVTAVSPLSHGWQITDADNHTYTSQALLLTPPVPQSLVLLANGRVPLSAANQTALERIQYAPFFSAVFQIEGKLNFPHPGAVYQLDQPIIWMADNRRKGLPSQTALVTALAGPLFTQAHWDEPNDAVLAGIRAAVEPYLAANAAIHDVQLIRWPYTLPIVLHPERCLLADNVPPLVFAGDAFQEPRIEGAALSGLAAADTLDKQLRGTI